MSNSSVLIVLFSALVWNAQGIQYGQVVLKDNPAPYLVKFACLGCQGVIIHYQHVLTTAVVISLEEVTELEAGSPYIGQGQTFKIDKKFQHPRYHPSGNDSFRYNIGVARIEGVFPGGDVTQVIEISGRKIFEGFPIEVVSLGPKGPFGDEGVLNSGSFTLMSDKECRALDPDFFYDPEIMFCAKGHRTIENICYEYGSPVLAGNLLVGISSAYVIPCRAQINAGIKVEFFLPWINSVIRTPPDDDGRNARKQGKYF